MSGGFTIYSIWVLCDFPMLTNWLSCVPFDSALVSLVVTGPEAHLVETVSSQSTLGSF